MGISEDEVYQEIQGLIPTIWSIFTDAYDHYRKDYPDLLDHRRSTRASIINDLAISKAISAFDEMPGIIPIHRPNQLRMLSISERVTLWFKKLDGHKETSNYPTDQAEDRDRGEQYNFPFKDSNIIVAGYMLNDDETAISRICFSPPNLVRPRWFIDVDSVVMPIQMKAPQRVGTTKAQLRITRGPVQYMLS